MLESDTNLIEARPIDNDPVKGLGHLMASASVTEVSVAPDETVGQVLLKGLYGRSQEWITDGLDDDRLKQVSLSTERFYHVDLDDNPIETDYPLGDLVGIIQSGRKDTYIWRQNDGDNQSQFMLTDSSFSIDEEGLFDGWWTPLEEATDLDPANGGANTIVDGVDMELKQYKGEYELAIRSSGNVSSRIIRAESRREAEQVLENKARDQERERQLVEAERQHAWQESQKFDNFVDYTSYDTFLSGSVEHFLGSPERTGEDDLGVKYTEVHVNAEGETYIIPAPRAMRPYGATLSGHHSIVDELRVYDGDDEFPNYMGFVNKLNIDTDTIKSKGYVKQDEEGNLVLELDQNRGNYAERADFQWLKDTTEAARKAGISKVILEESRSDEVLEIDLDAETERHVSYEPKYEPFYGSELRSPTVSVGVLETITVDDVKPCKVGHHEDAKVKNIQKIHLEGSEADIKLHPPLYERVEKRREGFKDSEYPISVSVGGVEVNLAVSYQYDRSIGEFGLSYRFEAEPPEAFGVVQEDITKKLISSFAMQSAELNAIQGTVSSSIGRSGLPSTKHITVPRNVK